MLNSKTTLILLCSLLVFNADITYAKEPVKPSPVPSPVKKGYLKTEFEYFLENTKMGQFLQRIRHSSAKSRDAKNNKNKGVDSVFLGFNNNMNVMKKKYDKTEIVNPELMKKIKKIGGQNSNKDKENK